MFSQLLLILSGLGNIAKAALVVMGFMKDNRNIRIGRNRAAQRGQKELLDDIQRDKERDILLATDRRVRHRLLRRWRDKTQG